MKTNPNENAFPSAGTQNFDESNIIGGLTKLEYMSTQIMQGLASRAIHADNSLAESAVKLARALIDELNIQDEGNSGN